MRRRGHSYANIYSPELKRNVDFGITRNDPLAKIVIEGSTRDLSVDLLGDIGRNIPVRPGPLAIDAYHIDPMRTNMTSRYPARLLPSLRRQEHCS